MGGIRLDWEIESNQVRVEEREDSALAQARRLSLLRLVMVIAIVLLILAVVALLLNVRLRQFDAQIEQLLRDTVDTEIAALRIGDQKTFMDLQRSATEDWFRAQEQTFNNYQTLKSEQEIQLTGHVIEVAISNQRGRVHVEEIINGISYTRLWFYWRYEDGWRHVPPDYTFWGEPQIQNGTGFAVRYQSVDAILATQFHDKLEQWLRFACESLTCADLPFITVDIVPGQLTGISWAAGQPWQLIVPSPYASRARSDIPFEVTLQLDAAGLLAERIVNHVSGGMQPVFPADAVFLRAGVVSWLIGRFVQLDTGSLLISSLANNHGAGAVGSLTRSLSPLADVGILSGIMGVPLDQSGLDWRDFFTWRLNTEDQLIALRDENNWLNLYDTRSDSVRVTAYSRYVANPAPEKKLALLAQAQTAPDGTPQVLVSVQIGNGDTARVEMVLFNLVNGTWRRAS